MRIVRALALVFVLTLVGTPGAGLSAPAQEIVFTSNQFTPVEEQEWARNTLLAGFTRETGITVRFITENEGPYVDRLLAEARAGRGTIDVTGTLHGIFPVFLANNALRDMAEVQRQLDARRDRTFFRDFLAAAKMDGFTAFIPWMQATYLIVAHKDALRYFPGGRNPMAMTYDDLLQWGENIRQATGQRRVGFPVGPRGLYGRFLHGYIYPSFTGAQVRRFRSPEAVEMWRYLRRLWGVTHPSSFTYEFMSEPLLRGEVLVGWDHVARIVPALRQRPDDFVVLPSPAGPRGRSFISVIVGLSIPRTAPSPDLGVRLIEYLTRPATQVLTLQGVGFFPVSPEAGRTVPSGALKVMADGVTAQSGAPDARTALLPVGLGARTGEFVPIYVDTFTRIAVRGEEIQRVLNEQAAKLEELYRATNAPCAPPDPPQRPCKPD
ncbi:MAG: ABC transporter substrate-binding protein [Armatimonadota bacterium]|nr:ABC transporter substrate-binding protein [Armatimonadota bacterium]MDR7451232.1 ABC transporter substrate-binding protein [Armatimonadota bacterium]MDR7466865.1 ABC transporter substrate-binding protein [Armatimonadota bacterium]MDR7492662.1 ABC transporter substrate-binding protein [Armatimonadota bacterium]MDR7499976.1 ABC transporter substrate-binding protein [Armatimonadota bacterium]